MALLQEIYKALEDTVGTQYICDDPAVLDSYSYPLTQTAIHMGPFFDIYTPRGEAVLMPGNAKEVQAIVRICNQYKLKLKASSTFWSAMGYPSGKNTIQLDMRRMDRIIEIDEKNMFAVIEPGVIGATLQAEAMKLGLNTHIIGAGSSCSPLASATSYNGAGPDCMFMGFGDENLLGLEWVMPDGEILRTGSLGSVLGWFCGEGPGPGVRGIIRGVVGAKGAMGVFTKCALKLYPWPGPPELPVEGTAPAYKAMLPDNFRAYTLAFPTWEAWADCCYQIWDAGIGYIAHRQFSLFGRELKAAMIKILTDPTKTLYDLEKLVQDPEIKKLNEEMKRDFQIVLAGMTPRDIEWQDKALDHILAETGGWKVAGMNEPEIRQWALLYLIRLGHKNLNLVYGGGYDGCFGMVGPPDLGTTHVEEVAEFKCEWERKGAIVDAGGDCMIGGIGGMGGGGGTMWENFAHFDPHDKESSEGTFDFFEACSRFAREKGIPPGMERWNAPSRGADGIETPTEDRENMLSATPQPSVFHYQRKIKEALDPNNLGDAYYMTLEEPKK
ncbi:MAG: FAD-binding oxidoreductase [Desulfatiglandaceae bacterium]|jgi:glycolate oxidase